MDELLPAFVSKYSSVNYSNWAALSNLSDRFKRNIKLVQVFGDDGRSAFLVTTSNQVFGVGGNKFGCLGIGTEQTTFTPTRIEKLCGQSITSIACGEYHVVALTKTGSVYTWGANDCGQLGNFSKINSSSPQQVIINTVRQIAVGRNHTIALTEDGDVLGWGQNNFCQITGNSEKTTYDYPVRCTLPSKIQVVQVACGRYHSAALTANGQVYCWGANDYGQSGQPCCIYTSIPTIVVPLQNVFIVKIACGSDHTLALNRHGKLFIWGCESPPDHTMSNDIREPIIDIAAHWKYYLSVAVTDTQVLSWGRHIQKERPTPVYSPKLNILEGFTDSAMPTISSKDDDLAHVDQRSFSSMFNEKEFSDVTINAGDETIYAHKVVLRKMSQHFKQLFESPAAVGQVDILKYSGVSYKAYIYYLYTGIVILKSPPKLVGKKLVKISSRIIKKKVMRWFCNAEELWDIAESYNEKQLSKVSKDEIKKNLQAENSAETLTLLLKYTKDGKASISKNELIELKSFVLSFIMSNFEKVKQSRGFTSLSKSSQEQLENYFFQTKS